MLANVVGGSSPGAVSSDSQIRICEGCGRPMLRSDAVLAPLTDREFDVVSLLTAGMSNQEIASRLSLSEKTIKLHLSNIYQKLGVTSRTEAALVAVGWLSQ
jgi:DNA-binding NarL/FixJ family response regulator